jgi:mono/diheme cytochrome c family protein
MFLAMLLVLIAFSPAEASPQGLGNSSSAKAAASTSQPQETVMGKQLFQRHCASCHFAETTAKKIGPGLQGLYARLAFSDGKRVTDASLTRWIEVGGKDMPGFKDTIKPEQIRELLFYIKTL